MLRVLPPTFKPSFLGREATERATISQVINSRHSSFLIVNQETPASRPAEPLRQYFQSPEAKSCAVNLEHSHESLSSSTLNPELYNFASGFYVRYVSV